MTRLIDADEFLRSEIERCGYVPFIGTCTSDNEVFKFALERQPTVDDVEVVRHGKWIEHKWAEESCDGLISNYECSECHSWFREWGHYCSDCGARMDGD